MDIKMPDINGFEAVSLIKKQKPHLIIIIQTAFAKTDDELTQREKNYDDMITKPINRNDLFKTMSKYLSE
jgi:CheY-like chemotaxis protein